MTLEEAAEEIEKAFRDVHHTERRAAVLVALARLTAWRDERFRRIRAHERDANSARWSARNAQSRQGAKGAETRAKQHDRAVQALEVELGLRKARS